MMASTDNLRIVISTGTMKIRFVLYILQHSSEISFIPNLQLKFTVSHDMKAPVMVFYEVHNFYQVCSQVISFRVQNHRQYVTSRSDSQLSGVSGLTEKDLASSCTYKLKVEGEPGRIYNPCGLAANSYFNGMNHLSAYSSIDVFKLKNKNYILNERDIAWERDRAVYKNPPEYLVDNVTYKWLYIRIKQSRTFQTSNLPPNSSLQSR